jgi:hypothetical protein
MEVIEINLVGNWLSSEGIGRGYLCLWEMTDVPEPGPTLAVMFLAPQMI